MKITEVWKEGGRYRHGGIHNNITSSIVIILLPISLQLTPYFADSIRMYKGTSMFITLICFKASIVRISVVERTRKAISGW